MVDEYIDFFSTRLKQNSQTVEEFIALGNLYRKKGEFQKAYRLHRNQLYRSDISKTQKAQVYATMGYDYLLSGTKDHGEHFFQSALSLDAKNTHALQGLLQVYRVQKKFTDMMATMEKLIKLRGKSDKQSCHALCEMALIFIMDHQLGTARKLLKRTEKYAQSPYQQLAWIHLYLREDNKPACIEHAKKMIRDYPRDAQFAISTMETLYYDMGKYSEYIHALQDIARSNPDHGLVMLAIGKYYEKIKQLDQAQTYFEKALDLLPHSLQVHQETLRFFNAHHPEKVGQTLQRFFQTMQSFKKYTCQQCQSQYDAMPKTCHVCGSWSLFDVCYIIPQTSTGAPTSS